MKPQFFFLLCYYNIFRGSKKDFIPYFPKNGWDMTIWSEVVTYKNAKNSHFWVFLETILHKNRSQQLEFNVGGALWCMRPGKKEFWCLGYYGVPKSAHKGPLKQKIKFFFRVASKMIGVLSNFKWKFQINATSFS